LNSAHVWVRLALYLSRNSSIRDRLREGYFPYFFADEKYPRRALEKVSKALGKLPGARKWQFFTTPRISLNGKTPLEALSKGQVDAVLSAAAFLDE
jgi:hypothetical protein